MAVIGENTKFTFAVLVALLGFASWMTTIYMDGQANAKELVEVKETVNKLESLTTDVAVIKAEVHQINRKLDANP